MRIRNQRGVAFPSPVVILSIVAVAMAGIAYVATQGEEPTEREVTTVSGPRHDDRARRPRRSARSSRRRPRRSPSRRSSRGEVYVEVYNNSGITGLAGTGAGTAAEVGWQVVGSDNWYGTIPSSTVYFPPRLQRRRPRCWPTTSASRGVEPAVGADAARPAHGDPDRGRSPER